MSSAPQTDTNSQKYEETLARMQQAFDEFHAAVQQLRQEQRDIIREINKRIDQKKIDDIHSLLKDAQHNP